ncbi:carbohydrate kinase [Shinella sp. CPCC 101442]|uniref:FGGY-family carbohydrate kinase n=1 Tax=Shinella sp. CPCC 101442 TaxID=2932265 RepID=UPI0021534B41|nr:FGGY-family carbohydrate kinase [Shinella sp. CPCC 101442]MCR6497425.1 carbohydrate kinase [Shinella sp. CPCC 101442]
MTAYLLGLDSGLTVTKAVVFREDGKVVALARREIAQIKTVPRHVERDMTDHWHASAGAIREALERASAIVGAEVRPAAVSVAGHGDGLYLLDRAGAPLGLAATSLDSRAQMLLQRWDDIGVSARALELTGQRPFPSSPAPLLAYLRDEEPERYARIGAILSCKDWLRYCLTGEVATDFTEASVAFTDIRTQLYSNAALELFGLGAIVDALPDVRMPCAVAGHVTQQAAAATGLAIGTPVATGLHDVTACAVGSGVTKAGTIAVIAGTYSINEMLVDAPKISVGWNARNGLRPGQWMNMSVSPASSANLDWFLATAARDALAGGNPFATLQAELDAVADDPSDIVYLPYLYGSPHAEDVPAAFLGLRGWHGRGHMLRAVAEGIVFNHRHHIDLIDPEREVGRVRLTGGSSRNPYFGQLFADALDRCIEVPEMPEAGALGAAIAAGIAAGVYGGWEDASLRTTPQLRTYHPGEAVVRLEAGYGRYREAVGTIMKRHEEKTP